MKLVLIFLTIGFVFNLNNEAFAKKRHARAFSFFDEGGNFSQAECDPEGKIPRKLKRRKEFSKAQAYLGSELLEAGPGSGGGVDAWKHYFSSASACNISLGKQTKPVH